MGSVSSRWVIQEMKELFDEVDSLNIKKVEVNLGAKEYEVLYNGEPIKDYHCIYAKGSFRYANLLRAVSNALYDKCYMPIEPDTFTVGHNKLLTHLKLQSAKIPMPKTYLSSTNEAAKKTLQQVPYPIIMKFPEGTHGKGVMFADSYEAASSMLDALDVLNQPFLIQEYIEAGGIDTRAIVVGDKVVASMRRKAIEGEKRANIHAGAKGESCLLDPKTRSIAIETAKAVGADICAVDILETSLGPFVIEVNLSPGLQGITKYSKINVAQHIAKYLYKRTLDRFEATKEKGADKVLADLGIKQTNGQDILTNLDFRGRRILLPEVVSQITGFNEKKEMVIKAKKGKLEIEELDIG